MRRLVAILLLSLCTPVWAQAIPGRALEVVPMLVDVQRSVWPNAPEPWFLAGQVEQETCPSLKSPKCFNTHTELKTSREYGFGLGQITIAYRADGSERFNNWTLLRQRYPGLRSYTWEQRFDAKYQLQALIEMDRASCGRYDFAPSAMELLGFCLSGYNGGDGGVMQDRMLCRNTPGCDRNRWFENVEKNSMKTRMPNKGYGKSAFDINREYPRLILWTRRAKYQPFFAGGGDHGAGR